MVREDGSFVKMSLVFSRRKEREKRTTREFRERGRKRGNGDIIW